MRASDVVGKRIVKVNQKRIVDGMTNTVVYAVSSFVLDDGTYVMLSPGADDGGDWVEVTTHKRKARRLPVLR